MLLRSKHVIDFDSQDLLRHVLLKQAWDQNSGKIGGMDRKRRQVIGERRILHFKNLGKEISLALYLGDPVVLVGCIDS